MNDLLLRAARGESVERTPVWIMRQAGRYLPEYMAVRAKASFRDLLNTPDLATEVTLQPIRRFDLDAAIIFSDILVVSEAMGLPFEIVKGTGPVMERTIRDAAAVDALRIAEPEQSLPKLLEAIAQVSSELSDKVPLLGFAGAPFTLATYMVEGGTSKNHNVIRRMAYEAPELLGRLLDKLAESVARVLRAQIKAGAAAVQLFETWASALPPDAYRVVALPAVRKILASLSDLDVPKIVYAGHIGHYLDDYIGLDAEVIGVDWRLPMSRAVAKIGRRHAVQGNLDPCALFLPRERLREAVRDVLDGARGAKGHIFNLGHGILPTVDPDQLGFAIDTVHELTQS